MKFTSIALAALGLTANVLATPTLHRRDLKAFTSVIEDIDAATKDFASTAEAYSGGDPSEVLSKGQAIVDTVTEGASKLEGEEKLTNSEALALTGPVQDLTDTVNTAIDAIIDKKSQIVEAGAGADVYQSLQDQHSAAAHLSEVISGKVPDALSDIAAELSKGITDAIQRGIDEYKDAGDGGDDGDDDDDDGDNGDGGDQTTTTNPPDNTATATETATETETSTGAPTETSSGSAQPTGGNGGGNGGEGGSGGSGNGGEGGSDGSGDEAGPPFPGAASTHRVGAAAGIVAAVAAVLAF